MININSKRSLKIVWYSYRTMGNFQRQKFSRLTFIKAFCELNFDMCSNSVASTLFVRFQVAIIQCWAGNTSRIHLLYSFSWFSPFWVHCSSDFSIGCNNGNGPVRWGGLSFTVKFFYSNMQHITTRVKQLIRAH